MGAGDSQAVEIEQIATGDLIPYARNSRTHTQQHVGQIAASIREFGFTNPVLVSDDLTIIAGHGRVQAAAKLGLQRVPCIRLSHLSESQRRAYVIADNRLALNAGWDDELLANELAALREDGFDLDLIGFDEAELAGLLDEQPADQPEPSGADAQSRVQSGEVWRVGEQWFVCGDSSAPSVVDSGLQGRPVGALVFDPEFDADFSDWDLLRYATPDTFVFGDCINRTHERCEVSGDWQMQLVWDGVTRHIVKGKPLIAHKTCDWYSCAPAYDPDGWFDPREGVQAPQSWSNSKGDVNLKGNAKGKRLASVFRAPVTDESHGVAKHGKPVLWLSMILANCSNGLILDLFSGTGAVSCAAARIGRASVAVELDPARVDYGITRTEQETGLSAERVDG